MYIYIYKICYIYIYTIYLLKILLLDFLIDLMPLMFRTVTSFIQTLFRFYLDFIVGEAYFKGILVNAIYVLIDLV